MVPALFPFHCLPWTLNMPTLNKLHSLSQPILTNAIQNPANCPVSSAGQDTEVWSVTEEVQPGKQKKGQMILFTRLWLSCDTVLGSETPSPFPSLGV